MAKHINLNLLAAEEEKNNAAIRNYKSKLSEDNYDWTNANVEGVTLDDKPLDGHYLERLMDIL